MTSTTGGGSRLRAGVQNLRSRAGGSAGGNFRCESRRRRRHLFPLDRCSSPRVLLRQSALARELFRKGGKLRPQILHRSARLSPHLCVSARVEFESRT